MIGPKNSQTKLHYDFLDSHAYLAQIVGRKRCLLFSPDDSPGLYSGKVDPDRPDWDKYPLFRQVTTYFCILEPGEILFIPSRWWHHVVALEKSITLNYNFFNRINFDAYLTHLLRDLPALVAGLDAMPEAKTALGIEWTSRGFDVADRGGRGTAT
jgi:ribosomal protein L16 Arg81 hydroxylase